MENNLWVKIIDCIIGYGCVILWIAAVSNLGIREIARNGLKQIFKPGIRRKLTYVSLVGLIGAVMVVHLIKHYIKRCRPYHLDVFGGNEIFTRVWIQNTAFKDHECSSFVSGHSAVGFLIFSLAFLYPKSDVRQKRYLLLGIAVGGLFGFLRIIQGKHFISDVIFSGYVVYFSALLLASFIKPSSQ